MPARALFDHGCRSLSMSRSGTAHLGDSQLAMELLSLVCFNLHAQQLTCHKQADNMQTCQNHRGKAKEHTGTEQYYRYMQSYSKHTTHTNSTFFFYYQASPLASLSARELQIQIHLAALSGCCKLERSILTLIRANEQHGHVLSKDPQTEEKNPFFAQPCSFPHENRCYVLYSDDYKRHLTYSL